MKTTILFLTLIAGMGMAQDQAAPPPAKAITTKKKAAAKKSTETPAPQFLTVPADATQNPDGTYSYTDKAGKKWNYWKSPFGVMRSEVKPGAPALDAKAAAPSPFQYTSSTDKGDTVRFERQTPFGPVGYDRKKSEMSDEERSLFELQHPESKAKPE